MRVAPLANWLLHGRLSRARFCSGELADHRSGALLAAATWPTTAAGIRSQQALKPGSDRAKEVSRSGA